MRIYSDYFNEAGMTTENSLQAALQIAPEKISPTITFLTGKEDNRFPLSFLTEGAGNIITINGDQYDYNVMGRMDQTASVAITSTLTNAGIGSQTFKITFDKKWFIKNYVLVGQSGTQVRIQAEPTPNGANWDYTVQLVNPDPAAFLPATDITQGAQFAQMYAPAGSDFSRGNASNWVAPSVIRHKLSVIRKSYSYSGATKNRVMWLDYSKPGTGANNKLWIDFEEYQHMLRWKMECEMLYWYGQQSYNAAGNTQLKDDNGSPIIIGPGLLEQIPNKEVYTTLTTNKIKEMVRDALYGMTDTGGKVLTLYTGTGGMDLFDQAMKTELASGSYNRIDKGTFVTGEGRKLSLGGFFTQYQHIDGYVINVVKLPLFDHGAYAMAAPKHPVYSNLSLESFRMVFVDQSNYDGQANVSMVTRKGREMLRWAVAGSTIPNGFSGNDLRASDIDGCSVHFLKTAGIVLKRFTTSIDLRCVAS